MSPELKVYMMSLMMPSLIDEVSKDGMSAKTKMSFARVTKYCEDQANACAEAFYKHESLRESHDAMINEWNRVIDNMEIKHK
jgi:hypothetical protein